MFEYLSQAPMGGAAQYTLRAHVAFLKIYTTNYEVWPAGVVVQKL